MIYEYKCAQCAKTYEVVKPMFQATTEEICPKHEMKMERVWTIPNLSFIGLKRDPPGQVCIGNEKLKIEPKLDDYSLPREVTSKFED